MDTIIKKINPDDIDGKSIDEAGQIIRRGGLVAFPTETVYGLGGDALNPLSSKKIYEAKGRPSDNPLIVHIADIDSLYEVAESVPESAIALAEKYWPGPLTMIFRKKDHVPKETTGGLDTVAVRFPSHPVAKAFIQASGGFVAAPSANLSGRPSPTNATHVADDMTGRIEMIIDSGKCDIGLESTIIDMTTKVPMMLRPGYVNGKMLEEVLGNITKDPAVFGDPSANLHPRAPGMKYRHYAPKGTLTIVSGEKEKVISYINDRISKRDDNKRIAILSCSGDTNRYKGARYVVNMGEAKNEIAIASSLYDALRKCDDENIDEIYSEEFDTPDLGEAIMNRLIKAAGHNMIKV